MSKSWIKWLVGIVVVIGLMAIAIAIGIPQLIFVPIIGGGLLLWQGRSVKDKRKKKKESEQEEETTNESDRINDKTEY